MQCPMPDHLNAPAVVYLSTKSIYAPRQILSCTSTCSKLEVSMIYVRVLFGFIFCPVMNY